MATTQIRTDFNEVMTESYVTGSVSVTTSEIEAKASTSALAGREFVMIQNKGPVTIYYGPSGVTSSTGMQLFKDQTIGIPLSDSNKVYLITASSTSTAIVQEFA